ncbi:hypothetical protein AVEN_44948-1 [Araneus ventricosus]|uniref:Endonuclease/exonuclease/phosphatase domain-containing protein n=1 Tax=Araneus ventricosus TaxID=182803 RepID=A0A4Y2WSV1_ARAVE|nr:hypothetical protein AVEN_44948-1 [Araneus ventricosus]
MVALKIQTSSFPLTIISAYSSPAQHVYTTLQKIQEIISSLPEEKIIIGADLNGHNTLWGCRSYDNRGKDILDFILANNLNIIDKPDALPNFQRNKSFKIKKQLLITKLNWWTEQDSLEIYEKKDRALRRRARNQVFKKEKAKYKRHIKQERNIGWRKFSSEASHTHGKQYKAAFRKTVFPSQIPYLINGESKGNLQDATQNILDRIFLSPAISTNYNLTTSTQPTDPPIFPQETSVQVPIPKLLPGFLENKKYYLIPERRKRQEAGLLLSSYFTSTDDRECAGETYDSEADISFGVHQQPEQPTSWLQRRQVCGYSHQPATKQNSNSKKRWQAYICDLY